MLESHKPLKNRDLHRGLVLGATRFEQNGVNQLNIKGYENGGFENTGNLTVLAPETLDADEITELFLQVFEQMESGEKLAFIKNLMGRV